MGGDDGRSWRLDATGGGRHLHHAPVGDGIERTPQDAITPDRVFPSRPEGKARRLATPFPGPVLSFEGTDRLASIAATAAAGKKAAVEGEPKAAVTSRSCLQLKREEGYDEDGVYEIVTETGEKETVYCAMSDSVRSGPAGWMDPRAVKRRQRRFPTATRGATSMSGASARRIRVSTRTTASSTSR